MASVLAGRQRRETVPEGPLTFASASHLHYAARMKTSALPAVRVEPALRSDAEAVLDEGESLSDGRRKAARALNDGSANSSFPSEAQVSLPNLKYVATLRESAPFAISSSKTSTEPDRPTLAPCGGHMKLVNDSAHRGPLSSPAT